MTPLETLIDRHAGPMTASGPRALQIGRAGLIALFRDSGFTDGAEIGVWKGAFATKICAGIPGVHLYAVDPWEPYDTYHEAKNDQRAMAEAKREALARLAPYRCTVLVATSLMGAEMVPDQSLDFVFLDANHEAAFVLTDLVTWIPKIRAGGIMAGHDYGDVDGHPYIQVKAAVDDFTARHGIAPWFELTAEKIHSFFWVVT